MNIRQSLIETIENDLRKITTGNGYNNTVFDVKRIAIIDAEQVSVFPTVWFEFQNEQRNTVINEDETYFYNTINLLIGGFVKTSNDISLTGVAVNEAEKLLQDIYDCVEKRKPQSFTIDHISYIEPAHVKGIYPYITGENNVVGVVVEVEIQYLQTEDASNINVTLPNAPTLSSPSDAGTVTTLFPSFDWASVSDAISYHIQVGTDTGFNSNIINQDYLVNNSYTIPADKTLTNGNTYYWKVRSFNQYGYSDWSSTRSFVVNSTAITPLDWNEFAGSNGWWNSYSTTGHIISSGVSALLDQIGSRNLTQSTSSRRPSLSGNAYGSLSSIFFNPTFASESDVLSYNDTGSAFKWGNSTTGSMILVLMSDGANFDINSEYFCPIARTNTNFGNELNLFRGVNTGPAGYTFAYPYPSGNYAIVPIGLNQPQHIILTHSGSSSLIYLNGTKIGQLTRAFTTFSSEGNSYLVLGGYYEPAINYASGRYTGHIFEAGFNTTVLTQSQVTASYEKFKDRFNL